jgi:hypothetical protein
MSWQYKNHTFNEDMIGDAYGFVYVIENTQTGRKYIGKKFFTKAGTKQVKGKRKKIRKSSDWENYYGSNKTLQEEVKNAGSSHLKRTILHLCKTRSECAYWETFEIINRGALLKEEYYNDWLMVRVRKDHLKGLTSKVNTDTYDIPEEKIHIL